MTEDIKGLIEKIQKEGIEAAEGKARAIENVAVAKAKEIADNAKAEAERILSAAKEEISRRQKSTQELLKQAGRDLILSLKEEINMMLEKVILAAVRQALGAEELNHIIGALIKDGKGKEGAEIVVSLNKEDCAKLTDTMLSRLQAEMKKQITLRPAEDINAGFIISFDSGKSHFDFTDKALSEYLAQQVKPQLADILKNG
ncbi:MAG: hypothetical protein ACOY3D_02955 [Candidatus Omnitrophota bacterium]